MKNENQLAAYSAEMWRWAQTYGTPKEELVAGARNLYGICSSFGLLSLVGKLEPDPSRGPNRSGETRGPIEALEKRARQIAPMLGKKYVLSGP